MPNNQINFQAALKRIVTTRISPLGYQKIIFPKWKGTGITFFQKHLFEDVYGYIQFQLGKWAPSPTDKPPMSKRFWIILIRNIGNEPDLVPRENESHLIMPLCYVLWDVYGINKYGKRYHDWKYFTVDELEMQLHMATEDLITYGLPW